MDMNKKYTVIDVLAASIQTHNRQGFVKSGMGHTVRNDDNNDVVEVIQDNKTVILALLNSNYVFTESQLEEASTLANTINGKMMLKKMTGNISSFDKNIITALSADPNNFAISIIASLPHSLEIDKKRSIVEDKMLQLKHSSRYFGEKSKRYDINVEVIDVKFIQSSSVYMISTVYASKDIIKFWWRDQPDLSELLAGKRINIKGTVSKHELSKYTGASETMLNRVKISKIL